MACVCKSERIAGVSGKCSDCCVFFYKDKEKNGYVPSDVGVGGGDYLEFDYCLDCGRIQTHKKGAQFPIPDHALEAALGLAEEPED